MSDFAAQVQALLVGYAHRGVFNGCTQSQRSTRQVFHFRWLLGHEFCCVVDPERALIILQDCLPAVPNRSFMDRDLRRFIKHRAHADVPEHRRLEAKTGELTYQNRKAAVSLRLKVTGDDVEDALRRLLGVVNDLFSHLHLYHIDYLHQEFSLPEE